MFSTWTKAFLGNKHIKAVIRLGEIVLYCVLLVFVVLVEIKDWLYPPDERS